MSRIGSGLGILVAMAIGVGACGGGGTKAHTALPAAPAVAAVAATGGTAPSGPESPTAPASATPKAAGPALAAPSSAAKKSAGSPQPAVAAPAAAAIAVAAPAAAAAVSTGVPRRVPTAAEVNQVISQVHSTLRFFTPTAADIASTGDQVCTAFDQGKTFSQVTSKALDMVGAGSYSWMIPSSAPANAVRGLVNLYCPGYAYKLG